MARSPRIEFAGAFYDVMARGNRREPIVFGNDDDRRLFAETFAEACRKTGWDVFAWVLMDNHYHAVFRTPEPTLVEGMSWMRNAYTRRLNRRHQLWGHLLRRTRSFDPRRERGPGRKALARLPPHRDRLRPPQPGEGRSRRWSGDEGGRRSLEQSRDGSERRSERILSEARKHFGKTEAELARTVRGDLARGAVARRLFGETTVSQTWIADSLSETKEANATT